MLWFALILALSIIYTACYAAHCFRCRHVRAAIGSIVLLLPPAALLIAFVSIMLQTA